MKIFMAPVQGHTDAAWRHYFNEEFHGVSKFYTPFIRCERNGIRARDVRDIESDLNTGIDLVPQVIFRDTDELRYLLDDISGRGFREIDLNMGCPFPLQTGHGRGAAVIACRPLLENVEKILSGYPDVTFSVKMRLGFRNKDEWKDSIDIINSMPLSHVTVHSRVARQQYKGEPDMEAFREFAEISEHPVVYNGDLLTVDDIRRVESVFPEITAVMIGRGLLGCPSLAEEYTDEKKLSDGERADRMLRFHDKLLSHYMSTLCGESQVLDKIKPFWEYAVTIIGRKAYKTVKKASDMAKYRTALASIGGHHS